MGSISRLLMIVIFIIALPIALVLAVAALAIALALLLLPFALVALIVFLIVRGVKKSKQNQTAPPETDPTEQTQEN